MATKPPPYSSKNANPANATPAQVESYYRRSMRRPSILGPATLIAIGTVALLVEMGKLSSFALWEWSARWWPLLLIAIGLISLGEWWMDRGSPYGRRHHYAGIIVLVLLLALLAHANLGLRRWGFFNNLDGALALHLFSHEYDVDHSLNQELPSRAFVNIHAPRGDVTMTPSGDNHIHVQAHEVVYAGDDAGARRAFAALDPRLAVSGKNVVLSMANSNSNRADLTIEIPADALATIQAGRGDVTVEGLNTPLKVTANRGDVKLDHLKAAADVRLGRGSFTARSVTGDISLEGRLNDVTISEVQGKVLLDGEIFGDLRVERITSQAHLHSIRTTVDAASLPGDLSLDSGALEVNNAAGPLEITTRAKDIQCAQISGDVHIEDRDGYISLDVAAQPGAIQIENRNGGIHLDLPRAANFALEATARNGEIHSDFNLPIISLGPGQRISGISGGGAKIELVADHGDIEIKRDPANARAIAPSTGEKGIRRLRAPPGGAPRLQAQ